MITVEPISFEDTFDVRHPVLRAGKPIESCFFDGDDLPTTQHFGAFVDKKLTGVVSVYSSKSGNFSSENQFQLRGMAVLPEAQKKGLGERLLSEAEKYITSQNGKLIWFNARENAVAFYQKMGYEKQGGIFEIPGVGPHYIMFRKIG